MITIVTRPLKVQPSNSATEQVKKTRDCLKPCRQGKTKVVKLRRCSEGFWHKV